MLSLTVADIYIHEQWLIKLGLRAKELNIGLLRFAYTFGTGRQVRQVAEYIAQNRVLDPASF